MSTQDGELFFDNIKILSDGNWVDATIPPGSLLADEFNDDYEINELRDQEQGLHGQNQMLPGQGGKRKSRKSRKTKKMRKSRK